GTGLLSSDRHLELSGDLRMQADWHAELAERLDRLIESDATSLDVELVLAEECGDVASSDRSEEPILIRGLPRHCQMQGFDGLRQLVGLGEVLGGLAVLARLDALQVLQVRGRRRQRQLVRQEIVPRIAIRDIPDLAAPTKRGNVFEQNDLHRPLYSDLSQSPVWASSATVRARRMARVSCRWCLAQLPEIRRGVIFPRSETNPFNRRTSL